MGFTGGTVHYLLVLVHNFMLSTGVVTTSCSEPFKELFQQIKDIVPYEDGDIQLQTTLSNAFAHGWCNLLTS